MVGHIVEFKTFSSTIFGNYAHTTMTLITYLLHILNYTHSHKFYHFNDANNNRKSPRPSS